MTTSSFVIMLNVVASLVLIVFRPSPITAASTTTVIIIVIFVERVNISLDARLAT
jgi:hypothetical protein